MAGTCGSATSSVVNSPSGSSAAVRMCWQARRRIEIPATVGSSTASPPAPPDRFIGHPAAVRGRLIDLVGQEGLGVLGVELQPGPLLFSPPARNLRNAGAKVAV